MSTDLTDEVLELIPLKEVSGNNIICPRVESLEEEQVLVRKIYKLSKNFRIQTSNGDLIAENNRNTIHLYPAEGSVLTIESRKGFKKSRIMTLGDKYLITPYSLRNKQEFFVHTYPVSYYSRQE